VNFSIRTNVLKQNS